MGVMVSRALLASVPGSSSTVMLGKWPCEASLMEAATRDSVPCCTGQFGKSHLPSQSDHSPIYPIWA
jgi:hypothetical protein